MTPERVYTNWHSSLKSPNDSIFYYHKSIERILLGLAIFVISSRPIVGKLEKAKMLKILHICKFYSSYQIPPLPHTILRLGDTFHPIPPTKRLVTGDRLHILSEASNYRISDNRSQKLQHNSNFKIPKSKLYTKAWRPEA